MAVKSIKIDECIGCGTCVESCPMDVFRLDTIAAQRPESSPCSLECPLGLDQREYHNLIKMDMMDEAAALLQVRHPMPSITGRICPHPCENDCSRGQVDEVININGLEQYLGDYLLVEGEIPEIEEQGDKIAVIGSGPAGLSCAYNLALAGYNVTVFEKDSKPGGLLRYSLPVFRLPEDVLDRQIQVYEKMGIAFKTEAMFGRDVTREGLAEQGYKAFVAATGASKPIGLKVPGSDAEGVISAISFLKDARTGAIDKTASNVVVVGGGSVALDAARTAVRLGAEKVSVICLEKLELGLKDSMLALASEIEEAQEEGIKILPSLGVESFEVTDGRVSGLACIECLSVRDENGRFSPDYGACVRMDMDVDQVIIATGQTADADLVPPAFNTNERGFIGADPMTLQVDLELFAAGDAVSGPSTVVQALASGKKAALAISRFLKGEELTAEIIDAPVKADGVPEGREIYTAKRITRCNLEVSDRVKGFRETMQPLSANEARMESERCLTCGSRSKIAYMDDCQVCRLCQHYCPTDAIEITNGAVVSSLHPFNVVKLGKALQD